MSSHYRQQSPQSDAVAQALSMQRERGHKAAWEYLSQCQVSAAVMLRVLSRQGPRRSSDTLPQPASPGVAAFMPATFRHLPLLRGQQAAIQRFLEAAELRGEVPDAAELTRMLHEMLLPPEPDFDDEAGAWRAVAERANGCSQDGFDAASGQEERLAAAEAEAMKRG